LRYREYRLKGFEAETFTILEYVLNKSKTEIIKDFAKEFTSEELNKLEQIAAELRANKPLQYIVGKQEFMRLEFKVNESVLIPQPDTEVVVEKAIEIIEKSRLVRELKKDNAIDENKEKQRGNACEKIKSKMRVLDLCTGSGAIAVSIAHYANMNSKVVASDSLGGKLNSRVTVVDSLVNELNIDDAAINSGKENGKIVIDASDISIEVLKVAKENAKRYEVDINFIQSDMFNDEYFKNCEKYDVIVSNPPYIKSGVIPTLAKDVQNEPHIALDGGEDGLRFYKIIQENLNMLRDGGFLVLETGYDQADELLKIFPGGQIHKDYAGNDRVLIYRKSIK